MMMETTTIVTAALAHVLLNQVGNVWGIHRLVADLVETGRLEYSKPVMMETGMITMDAVALAMLSTAGIVLERPQFAIDRVEMGL